MMLERCEDRRLEEIAGPGAGWVSLLVRNLLVLFTIVVVIFDWAVAFALLPRLEAHCEKNGVAVTAATKVAFSLQFQVSMVVFSIVSIVVIFVLWKLFDSRCWTVLASLMILILSSLYAAFMLLAALMPFVPMFKAS